MEYADDVREGEREGEREGDREGDRECDLASDGGARRLFCTDPDSVRPEPIDRLL